MKKLLACVFAVAVMTGCGGKANTESKSCSIEENGMGMETIFEAKDNKIINAEVKMNMDTEKLGAKQDFSKVTDEQKESLQGLLENQLGIKEGSGVEVNFDFEGSSVNINMKVDFEKASADTLKSMGMDTDVDMDLEKSVKSLEDGGFTCK